MDSTLALGAFRIARGAGGEAVDVNGNLVEREKGDEFGIETPASSSTMACGQQKVKGGHGSNIASSSASSSASCSASCSASIITLNLVEREKHHLNLHLNLGVGCAPSCWPIFGFRNLLGAPFLILGPRKDHIEWLSVCGIDTCSVNRAVRKYDSEQLGFFGWGLPKIKKMRLIREFYN